MPKKAIPPIELDDGFPTVKVDLALVLDDALFLGPPLDLVLVDGKGVALLARKVLDVDGNARHRNVPVQFLS